MLLLAGAFAGPLASAGCVTAPGEEPGAEPAREGTRSAAISGNNWPQPVRPEFYYTFMASAAAAAYPARFEDNTRIYANNIRSLRSLPTMTIDSALTDDTKVTTFLDASDPNVARMIIAFRGTVHPTFTAPLSNWTDIVVDLSSQFVKVDHHNPLPVLTPIYGRVGGGWETRWHQVAAEMNNREMTRVLQLIADASRNTGQRVEINVVGHSLGGVVAELAGFDIEEFMRFKGANYEVNVVAFNPPKLGSRDFVNEYRKRLKERPDRFRISVFTREGDLVDDVPIDLFALLAGFFHQVIANVPYDNLSPLCSQYMAGTVDNPMGAPPEAEALRLPYAPRIHVTKPYPYGSHSIDDWNGKPMTNVLYRQVFGDTNPNGFRCMFAPNTFGTPGVIYTDPPDPKLNCTAYATARMPDDCDPNPPPPTDPRDEL
jgi:hypothetical protein